MNRQQRRRNERRGIYVDTETGSAATSTGRHVTAGECAHELVPARCHSGCTIDVAHCGACGMPAVERRGA